MNQDQRRIETLIERVPADATRILDVGCVRHDETRRQRGNLHAQLNEVYPDAEVIGIDLPGPETRKMQAEGYDVVEMDCQEMDVDASFDGIVAGEVIEHLPNPGMFLRRASEHLKDDSPIILSTPNPAYILYEALALKGRYTSDDHTCWIDERQLQTLCDRSDSGLDVTDVVYIEPDGVVNGLWKANQTRISAPYYVGVLE